MNATCWKLLVMSAVFIPLATLAHAQPSCELKPTIEGIVLNADTIVVGMFAEFSVGEEFHNATIAVENTLRGEHHEQVHVQFFAKRWQVGVPIHNPAQLALLKTDSHRLLLALEGHPRHARTVRGLIDLSSTDLAVYMADFSVLRKPEDVLLATKDAIGRSPGVTRIETLPVFVPMKGGYPGMWHWGGRTRIVVPVDGRLGKRAQEYLTAQEPWKRMEGLWALRYFKTDENISQAKTLLSDPFRVQEQQGMGKIWRYPVRKRARETLSYWGVHVSPPPVDEERWKPGDRAP